MADTFKFQKDWYENIINDKFVTTSPQEMAYILYAAMQYAFNDGNPIDLGEVFGEQFVGLNRSMPNIYGQMDKIKNYEKNKNEEKYDNDAIYRLRMKGKTGKEICKELGYPADRERSLSSTKGWVKAREDKKKGLTLADILNTEICIGGTDNTEICTDVTDSTDSVTVQNTETVQKNTESVQFVKNTDDTESVQTVQESVKLTTFEF